MNELPEAPASATTKVKTSEGYEWLITTRATTMSELLKRVDLLNSTFKEKKYDPVIQAKYPGKNDKPKHPNAGKETGERCSNCGGVMVYSNQGKAYCKNLCWKK